MKFTEEEINAAAEKQYPPLLERDFDPLSDGEKDVNQDARRAFTRALREVAKPLFEELEQVKANHEKDISLLEQRSEQLEKFENELKAQKGMVWRRASEKFPEIWWEKHWRVIDAKSKVNTDLLEGGTGHLFDIGDATPLNLKNLEWLDESGANTLEGENKK